MTPRARARTVAAWSAVAVVLVAGAASVVAFDGAGAVHLSDVNLLAEPLGDDGDPVDPQTLWAIDFANGAPTTPAEVAARFTPSFLRVTSADELLAGREALAAHAPYRPWVVLADQRDLEMLLLVSRTGDLYQLGITVDPSTARIDGLSVFPQDVDRRPIGRTSLLVGVVAAVLLALVGALLFVRDRRDRRLGAWLLAAAVLSSLRGGMLSSSSAGMTVAVVAGPAAFAVVAWALLRTVPSFVVRRVLAAGTALAAAAAIAGRMALPLPSGIVSWWTPVEPSPATATTWLRIGAVTTVLAAGGIVLALVFEAVRRPLRRQVVFAVGGTVAAAMTAMTAASWLAHAPTATPTTSVWLDAALCAVAIGAGVGLFADRWELGGVARMVTDLGDGEVPDALDVLVGRALGDPSVELWYWSDDLAGFVTPDGEHVDPDALPAGRVATRLSARGAPLAIVVHDAARSIPDDRVAAVCAAARMALDNERLQARVRAQLAETRASRARILAAADDARREVERNLHDGAQQRLLAALLHLRGASARYRRTVAETAGPEHHAADSLVTEVERAGEELAAAIDELRAVARGLHPPALDRGLPAALDALAETAPLPVEVSAPADLATGNPTIDAAVYFFVAEVLTNTVRHAAATHLTVQLTSAAGELVVTAVDDGQGGARLGTGTGTGLRRLADRAAALGGEVTLTSRRGAGTGTTVRLRLPLAHTAGAARAVAGERVAR